MRCAAPRRWKVGVIGTLFLVVPVMLGAVCEEDVRTRNQRLGNAMEAMEREDREVQWNKERNEVVFVVTTKTLEGSVVGARVSRHGGQMYAVSVVTGQLKLLNEPPGDGRDMGRYGMAYDRSFDLCEGGSEVLFSTLRFSSERGSYSTARLLFKEQESVVVGQRGGSWIDGDYGEIHPRCQPGGGWIAALVDDRVFQGGEEAYGFGLYLMDYEGENSRRVDSAGRTSHIAPRWSPNGKALAFVDVEGRVSAVEVESGRVWKGGQLGLEGDFAWAPCSCKLAYVGVTDEGASQTLEVWDLKEERVEVLLVGYFGALTWVQDGTAVIFGSHNARATSGWPRVGPGLVRLDVGSGEMERLNDWNTTVLGLAWDREGSWLAVRVHAYAPRSPTACCCTSSATTGLI